MRKVRGKRERVYIFIGLRGDIIETTRTIHKITRGILLEKWN